MTQQNQATDITSEPDVIIDPEAQRMLRDALHILVGQYNYKPNVDMKHKSRAAFVTAVNQLIFYASLDIDEAHADLHLALDESFKHKDSGLKPSEHYTQGEDNKQSGVRSFSSLQELFDFLEEMGASRNTYTSKPDPAKY